WGVLSELLLELSSDLIHEDIPVFSAAFPIFDRSLKKLQDETRATFSKLYNTWNKTSIENASLKELLILNLEVDAAEIKLQESFDKFLTLMCALNRSITTAKRQHEQVASDIEMNTIDLQTYLGARLVYPVRAIKLGLACQLRYAALCQRPELEPVLEKF